ncbi:ABC transporter substrate-binding protein [Bradyrhizobium vignae]|uniref:ABC transporter substrate-binding protein n=1 Tax=Bradyrhizobium vignae TaxID=1549949 RepID=UPI00100A59C9|nr:ABC transporter substrate-binding protein [Bradyrhizobium vignae]RXH06628.1 branched-chain amino acid ABC transporter substrate-binding protein [Bradyrhizobium vignae]
MRHLKLLLPAAIAGLSLIFVTGASAQKIYDPGASDTEIKIGNIVPYSGPLSAYATIGRSHAAYFKKINDEGGINGRKLVLVTYDDAYSPSKAMEQTRKLVESDEVLAVFSSVGTPTNLATQKYLNSKKVPQLFVATGASRWGDPANFPWTMGWQPTYKSEGRILGKYIVANHPGGKIAVLWQNDDSGRDILTGLREGLGSKANQIIAERSYEATDPTVDSQVAGLRDSGANIFVSLTAPKAAAQAIRKSAEIGWKPVYLQSNVSTSVSSVLQPGGLDNSKDIISTAFLKDPSDPTWKEDPATKDWFAFMDKYFPDGDKTNSVNVLAYASAQTLVHVLKQCGDDLTRANVMRQAARLKDFRSEMMLPGIVANTSESDFYPLEQLQMMKFDGKSWVLFGDIIDASSPRH